MKVDVKKTKAYESLPTIRSLDTDWIKWIDLLEKKYGLDLAKRIFIAKWNKSGSQAANTFTLRSHLKKSYDIEVNESVFNKIVDLGGGISESFGKILKVGKTTLIIAGVVIALAVVGTVISTIKSGVSPLKRIKA